MVRNTEKTHDKRTNNFLIFKTRKKNTTLDLFGCHRIHHLYGDDCTNAGRLDKQLDSLSFE